LWTMLKDAYTMMIICAATCRYSDHAYSATQQANHISKKQCEWKATHEATRCYCRQHWNSVAASRNFLGRQCCRARLSGPLGAKRVAMCQLEMSRWTISCRPSCRLQLSGCESRQGRAIGLTNSSGTDFHPSCPIQTASCRNSSKVARST